MNDAGMPQVEGGARNRASEFQGVEAHWPLSLAKKINQKRTKQQKILGDDISLREGKAGS